jgi:hypothetical protein
VDEVIKDADGNVVELRGCSIPNRAPAWPAPTAR